MASSATAADLEEVTDVILDRFGGARGLATLMWAEFTSAPAGSIARQRYLKMILDLKKELAVIKQDSFGDLLSALTSEELAVAFQQLTDSANLQDEVYKEVLETTCEVPT